MSTRVLYDFLQVRGGAERVSLMLARQLPARLLVHAVAPRDFSADALQHVDSLARGPLAPDPVRRAASAWRGFARLAPMPDVDAALFSGHYAPLAWRAFPQARRVLYLHGPPLPFAYDRDDPGLARLPAPARALMRFPMARLVRAWTHAAEAMHVVFANSRFVAAAFERATGRSASVLPPPVDERFFACARASEGYWISLARHEPMKRVERIVDAFVLLPQQRLVVAGEGSESAALRRRAAGAPNIHFTGALDTATLAHWLGGARASIHVSRAEPFGLAIAESLAAGVPVLTCAEGAAAELVCDPHAGTVLGADPDVATLRAAIAAFDPARGEPVSSRVQQLRPAGFVTAIRAALDAAPGPSPALEPRDGTLRDA